MNPQGWWRRCFPLPPVFFFSFFRGHLFLLATRDHIAHIPRLPFFHEAFTLVRFELNAGRDGARRRARLLAFGWLGVSWYDCGGNNWSVMIQGKGMASKWWADPRPSSLVCWTRHMKWLGRITGDGTQTGQRGWVYFSSLLVGCLLLDSSVASRRQAYVYVYRVGCFSGTAHDV